MRAYVFISTSEHTERTVGRALIIAHDLQQANKAFKDLTVRLSAMFPAKFEIHGLGESITAIPPAVMNIEGSQIIMYQIAGNQQRRDNRRQ